MTWTKGQSGNPKGRKPGMRPSELSKLVRNKAGEDAKAILEQLFRLAELADPAVRLAAIREILNRGWGKPLESHQLIGPDDQPTMPKVRVIFGTDPPSKDTKRGSR